VFLSYLYIKPKQTAAISFMQCKILTVDVLFHVMSEGNHDLCGGVAELDGICG
jgi:hypothetical protein